MEQLDLENKEWQDALQIVNYTRRSLFLTGKAGTGKSTFLRYVSKHTKKKHVILAPTGIAAINAGAKFCPECGAKQNASAFCTSCGKQIPVGTKFCPECGAKQ